MELYPLSFGGGKGWKEPVDYMEERGLGDILRNKDPPKQQYVSKQPSTQAHSFVCSSAMYGAPPISGMPSMQQWTKQITSCSIAHAHYTEAGETGLKQINTLTSTKQVAIGAMKEKRESCYEKEGNPYCRLSGGQGKSSWGRIRGGWVGKHQDKADGEGTAGRGQFHARALVEKAGWTWGTERRPGEHCGGAKGAGLEANVNSRKRWEGMSPFCMVHNLSSSSAQVKTPAVSPHKSEAGNGRRLEGVDEEQWKEKPWDQADSALTASSQCGLAQLGFPAHRKRIMVLALKGWRKDCMGVGEMGKGSQKGQTWSCKRNKSWGCHA